MKRILQRRKITSRAQFPVFTLGGNWWTSLLCFNVTRAEPDRLDVPIVILHGRADGLDKDDLEVHLNKDWPSFSDGSNLGNFLLQRLKEKNTRSCETKHRKGSNTGASRPPGDWRRGTVNHVASKIQEPCHVILRWWGGEVEQVR